MANSTVNFNVVDDSDGFDKTMHELSVQCTLRYPMPNTTNETYCPAVYDGMYCWPPIKAGNMIATSCYHILQLMNYSLDDHHKRGGAEAIRVCLENATWLNGNQTNYAACLEVLPTDSVIPMVAGYIMFILSLISLLTLLITLYIFTYFKVLQCCRLRVHKNLVVSLILHSGLLLAISLPAVFHKDASSFKDVFLQKNSAAQKGTYFSSRVVIFMHDWTCKAILCVKMYSAMASIYWMFVEGLLLHSRITFNVFQQEAPFKLYYFIGWGVPLICVCAWTLVMNLEMRQLHCWKGYGDSQYVWIISGPMLAALLVNTAFLMNILRILLTKLKSNSSVETKQLRKLSKATALLFPLLGITHLFFCINPRDDAVMENVYVLCNALLQSSQGLFVSVLYCFGNSEVQAAIRNAYLQAMIRRNPNKHSRRRRAYSSTYYEPPFGCDSRNGNHKVAPLKKLHSPLLQKSHSGVEIETLDSIGPPKWSQSVITSNCYM